MPRQPPDDATPFTASLAVPVATHGAVNEQVAGLVGQGRFREALAALPLDETSSADLPPIDRARRLELEGVVRRELGQYAQAESPLLQGPARCSALCHA